MPDVPGKPGDAFDPEDENRRDDDSDPKEDHESSASRDESQPEGIGEEEHYYPAAELLRGMSSDAILVRLMDGDPLGIRQRCAERVRERCHLVFFDSLTLRTAARIAHAGVRYRGQVPFDRWVRDRIDEAIQDLLEEEHEAERSGVPASEPWETHYVFISELLGVEPGMTRRGCIRFNNLEHPVREVFFALCVDAITLNRYVAEGNGPPERVKGLLRQAYRALSMPDEEWEYGDDLFGNNDLEELP